MARLIFENLTLEQAKELAHWYEGSGEQSADVWFDCRMLGRAPITNMKHEGGFMQVEGEDVRVFLK